jgi:hypothetical protein
MSADVPIHLENKRAVAKLKELAVRTNVVQRTFNEIRG